MRGCNDKKALEVGTQERPKATDAQMKNTLFLLPIRRKKPAGENHATKEKN